MVFDEAFPKGIAIFDSERPANYDLNALSLPKDKNKPILKFKFNNSQTKLEEWIEELKSLGWVQI